MGKLQLFPSVHSVHLKINFSPSARTSVTQSCRYHHPPASRLCYWQQRQCSCSPRYLVLHLLCCPNNLPFLRPVPVQSFSVDPVQSTCHRRLGQSRGPVPPVSHLACVLRCVEHPHHDEEAVGIAARDGLAERICRC